MPVSIKWLAHAGFRIKAGDRIIYIDLEKEGEASEKADIVLVTHSHTDHSDVHKLKKIIKKDTVIITPKNCIQIEGEVRILQPGEEVNIKQVKVKAVEAYNFKRFRSPGKPFHPKGYGIGFLITVENRVIYHAGDTDFIPEMKQLGHVDVALLPSGGTYTMDNNEAAEAAITIIGILEPNALETTVVTGVSSIPHAILLIVLAVAGATKIKSTLFITSPANLICSICPVKSVVTTFPVAHSMRFGCIIF